MTIQEAIKDIKSIKPIVGGKSLEIAIQALEELEQYRALGTVEELKEAREKQKTRREWYQKGYQDGLNADKWISCEERLPDEAGCYLVTTDGRYNDIVDIAFYNAEDEVWYKASKILAWQPLPQPYKKEGAE